MSALPILKEEKEDGILYLSDFSFNDALIGISDDNRAIYDYDKMIICLAEEADLSEEDAEEWINYNTIRALTYLGAKAPIIMYPLN